MRKLDLLLGLILVLVSGIFYYMTSRLPANSRVYPYFVITLLLGLTLIHLLTTLRKKEDPGEKSGFEEFKPKQFFTVLGLSGLYVAAINIVGYISSTIIYIISTLLVLKTDKRLSFAIGIGVSAVIYVLFKILLRVPLPRGFLI